MKKKKKRRKIERITLKPKFSSTSAKEELVRASSPISVLEGLLNNGVDMTYIIGQIADIAETGGSSTRLAGVKMLLDCMRPHRLFFDEDGPMPLPALPQTSEVSRAVDATLNIFREERDVTEHNDHTISNAVELV